MLLKFGSRGPAVREIQSALASLGVYGGDLDGDFGPLTLTAVRAFQETAGLLVDGKVGPRTREALALAALGRNPAEEVPAGVPSRGFYIDSHGWIYDDGKRVRYVPAADHSGPMRAPPQVFTIHYDAVVSGSSVGILTRKDRVYISSQGVLDRDGVMTQLLPAHYVAWHAGDMHLPGVEYHGGTANHTSIGIECANGGWLNKWDREAGVAWRVETWRGQVSASPRVPIEDCVFGPHPYRPGWSMYWPKWPERQIDRLADFVLACKARWPDTLKICIGHDEGSAAKRDPGLAFNADAGGIDGFRERVGMRGLR